MSAADRFTVAAVITWHDDVRRVPLGAAASRRKARRIGYRQGTGHYPLHSSAHFEIEIIDSATGARVRADGAEHLARARAMNLPTVGDLGYW